MLQPGAPFPNMAYLSMDNWFRVAMVREKSVKFQSLSVREKSGNFLQITEVCILLSKSWKSQGILFVVPINRYFNQKATDVWSTIWLKITCFQNLKIHVYFKRNICVFCCNICRSVKGCHQYFYWGIKEGKSHAPWCAYGVIAISG